MLEFNPCHRVSPLYGWPLLGGSVMGSSTVFIVISASKRRCI